MEVLIVSLVGLVALTAGFYFIKRKEKKEEKNCADLNLAADECCKAHEVCEKEAVLRAGTEVIYYDDEELDLFINKKDNDYTVQEIEMFEEVLYTLKEEEVAGWLRSLQQRNIELPERLKDEALLIISEKNIR